MNFLFENVAMYAKAEPQQIEWGKTIDGILERTGCITQADIDTAATIWRGKVGAVEDLGIDLVSGVKPKVVVPPTLVISKRQAEDIFLNKIYDNELVDLNNCVERFEINKTNARLCFFMAQICHESGGLKWVKELDQGWYIPENFGLPAIAASDGAYKYRGAGALQLSMPENYLAFSKFMNDPKIYDLGCPYVAEVYPFSSAGHYWKMNKLNECIDAGEDMYQISGRVNTGNPNGVANHMNERLDCYYRAVKVLG